MGFISGLIGNAGVIEPEMAHESVGTLLVPGEKIEVGF